MAAKSGQITIASNGTAQQGPSTPVAQEFVLKAHPDNVGNVYVGDDGGGDVASSNGMVLAPGDAMVYKAPAASIALSDLWFDAANDNDVICWLVNG